MIINDAVWTTTQAPLDIDPAETRSEIGLWWITKPVACASRRPGSRHATRSSR